MRRAITIAALAATGLLHVYTGKKIPAAQSPKTQTQSSIGESGPLRMLALINGSLQGDRITVIGRVSDIWEPTGERAPHTLILRDGSGVLETIHWLSHPPRVDIGDSVECTGTVDLYRGRLQLRLWTSEDLKVLGSWKYICSDEAASSGQ